MALTSAPFDSSEAMRVTWDFHEAHNNAAFFSLCVHSSSVRLFCKTKVSMVSKKEGGSDGSNVVKTKCRRDTSMAVSSHKTVAFKFLKENIN